MDVLLNQNELPAKLDSQFESKFNNILISIYIRIIRKFVMLIKVNRLKCGPTKFLLNLFIAILSAGLSLFNSGCSSVNDLSNMQSAGLHLTQVPTPTRFRSPQDKLIVLKSKSESIRPYGKNNKINFKSKEWYQYVSAGQAYEDAFFEQKRLEAQLENKQELSLEKGQSYSFDLEAFCIDPHRNSPGMNDGLKLSYIPKEYENWMPDLLAKYRSEGLSQEEAQTIIWAIVSDTKFDELSRTHQSSLLKIFPDANIRFGNRRFENLAQDVLRDLFPELSDTIENLKSMRNEILQVQDDFKALKDLMVPPANDQDRTEPQWFQLPDAADGIFVRLRADGYSLVHVDLYVNDGVRIPQSMNDIIFSVTKLLGVPNKGQRLAVSPRSQKKSEPQKNCESLKTFIPTSCHEMTDSDRTQILKMADPSNFPKTRYGAPEGPNTAIEKVTDCSHFTQEIYHRAGFDFPYAQTKDMDCLPIFEQESLVTAKPGDLVMFPGHVGILGADGKVISATSGGPNRLSTLEPDNPGFKPSITRYEIKAFGKLKGVYSWHCTKK